MRCVVVLARFTLVGYAGNISSLVIIVCNLLLLNSYTTSLIAANVITTLFNWISQ
jgi:putative flippase GtrA